MAAGVSRCLCRPRFARLSVVSAQAGGIFPRVGRGREVVVLLCATSGFIPDDPFEQLASKLLKIVVARRTLLVDFHNGTSGGNGAAALQLLGSGWKFLAAVVRLLETRQLAAECLLDETGQGQSKGITGQKDRRVPGLVE